MKKQCIKAVLQNTLFEKTSALIYTGLEPKWSSTYASFDITTWKCDGHSDTVCKCLEIYMTYVQLTNVSHLNRKRIYLSISPSGGDVWETQNMFYFRSPDLHLLNSALLLQDTLLLSCYVFFTLSVTVRKLRYHEMTYGINTNNGQTWACTSDISENACSTYRELMTH